ncbi:MAG: dihydrolipoyl dehydrogenase [Halanaerobiales bacterium]
MQKKNDITIIGGGPGGYVAAIKAAQLGAKVVLVEKDKVGGTCLNIGCIPTKALVHSAELFENMKNAKNFGVRAENVSLDMDRVMKNKKQVVNRLVRGVEQLLKANQVSVVQGKGILEDEHTVKIERDDGTARVESNNIIIATGSNVSTLPVPGNELPGVINSTQALDLKKLPGSMIIVGGGYIGMEFAFIFNNFGVDVTVVEFLHNILSNTDVEVRKEVEKIARRKGINILTDSKVEEIEKSNGKLSVIYSQDGQNDKIAGEKVLISVGREPNLTGIKHKELGIKLDENERGIKVNKKMQTSVPHIYAIGDVTDQIQLAHVASHQGVIAAKNIMGEECEIDYKAVPSVIFTSPEIASVGLSKQEAEEKGYNIEIGEFPYRANGKAVIMGARHGFVKLVQDKDSGRIIGGSILGIHASDLITELTLAVEQGLTAKEIAESIHVHPTISESIHEAALELTTGAIHFYNG